MIERLPICYGYGRHSTAKQEMTREAQEFRVVDYYERNLKPKIASAVTARLSVWFGANTP